MPDNNTSQEKTVKLPWFGIPKLMPFLKPYLPTMALMIFLGSMVSMVDSFIPLFNRYALNNYIAKGTVKGIGYFALIYAAVLLIKLVMDFILPYFYS